MRTAVIGAGRMGRRHIQVVQQLGFDLIGVQDRSAEALRIAKAECGLCDDQLFSDPESLFSHRPECVIVAVTAQAHAHYTCWAADVGARYILCEKPLATSLAECDQAIELCRRHGAKLAVNHQMRFMEQYTTPKRMLSSEAFGGLQSIQIFAGNFGLAMNGTHYFEMFRFMAGEPVVHVSAWFSPETVPNPRGPQFEDRAGCVRALAMNGTRFYLDCSADQGHGLHVVYGGRNGYVCVDELAGQIRWQCRNPEHRDLPTTRYGMPWTEGYETIRPADSTEPTKAVLAALTIGGDYPTGEEGRAAVATLVAAYLSHERNGATVTIEEAEAARNRSFPWA